MAREIGNERVLTELADTMTGYKPVTIGLDETVAAPEPGGSPETAAEMDSRCRHVEKHELGRGGLGVVLEVFDQDLLRTIALKRPREDRMNGAAVAALVREAQITAQLDHPNIPAVHQLGIDEHRRPFFTMTRLGGTSLAGMLEARRTDPAVRAQLTTPRVLRILLQVGYALAFAHDRGVIHRDIKPDNIIIGQFGEVRLMDWGIAKLMADEPESTQHSDGSLTPRISGSVHETADGTFIGTPGYAPPEQIEGQADLDARADIYALGVTLYEMLTGRLPIKGETLTEVMDATLQGRLQPIRKLAPVSERLACIVHKALATDRDERYADVMSMLQDVECLLEGRPVSAHEEGTLEKTRRWYFGRSPRMARLKNVHIDMLSWTSYSVGISTGIAYAYWDLPWLSFVAAICLVIGIVFSIPIWYTLARHPRPEDPGEILPFTEGIATSSSLPGGTQASTMGTAPTVASEDEE